MFELKALFISNIQIYINQNSLKGRDWAKNSKQLFSTTFLLNLNLFSFTLKSGLLVWKSFFYNLHLKKGKWLSTIYSFYTLVIEFYFCLESLLLRLCKSVLGRGVTFSAGFSNPERYCSKVLAVSNRVGFLNWMERYVWKLLEFCFVAFTLAESSTYCSCNFLRQ